MRARAFLTKRPRLHERRLKRWDGRDARCTKLGARVRLYECASTYAARSCLMTLRVAEFNNRTMYERAR